MAPYMTGCFIIICIIVFAAVGSKTSWCMLSCFSFVQLFETLWTEDCLASLSMVFSMQEYWSGLPCPSLGDLSDQIMEPGLFSLLHWQVSCLFFCLFPPALAPPRKSKGMGLEGKTSRQEFYRRKKAWFVNSVSEDIFLEVQRQN